MGNHSAHVSTAQLDYQILPPRLVLFARLALLILHEYCHDGDDRSTHTHSPEFYSQYEHLADQVVSLAATAYNGYVNSITQSAKRLTKQQAKAALRNKQAKHVEAALDTLAAD